LSSLRRSTMFISASCYHRLRASGSTSVTVDPLAHGGAEFHGRLPGMRRPDRGGHRCEAILDHGGDDPESLFERQRPLLLNPFRVSHVVISQCSGHSPEALGKQALIV